MQKMIFVVFALVFAAAAAGQRITTIQLDGVQYFISRMNPYSPELNYFLAYQYCRSIGLQLASFETKEKSDSIMQYLNNAGYNKYDFWTSGNRLGTDMFIWLSTGLPFNATFDYMKKRPGDDMPIARQLGAVEQRKDSGSANGCVALAAPDLQWDTDDCTKIKDFICEQTRCYYYNYGSIPVSSAQGGIKGNPSTLIPSADDLTTPRIKSDEKAETSSTPSSPPITFSSFPSTSPLTTTSEPTPTATPTTTFVFNTDNDLDSTTQTPPGLSQLKARTLTRTQEKEIEKTPDENVPWSWARNIMLEKPVLKKSANL